MDDINQYLKTQINKLPLSHQKFIHTSVHINGRTEKEAGNNINKKYRLFILEFNGFYKPITTYLK